MPKRNSVRTLLITIFALFALTLSISAQAESPRFETGDCPFSIPEGATVDCGTLVVPENRGVAETNEVRLAVAIFRAETPAADPVIFLQGGPGGGIVQQMSFYYSSFIAPINTERDFIVFDQRGTGLSTPALNCPQVTALFTETLRQDLAPADANPLYIEAFNACNETLKGADIDLAAYTSAASAADIADLITTLGYETANLFGGSYGTRLALTVMRDFPTMVRSAVLDSVLPPEANQIEIIAAKSDYALGAFFAGCAADAGCAAAYPDLEAIFYATVERLNTIPAAITVTIPTTGESIETTVDGIDFIGSVFFGLQQTQLIPSVPATIQAVSEGDLTPLQTFITLPILIADGVNVGMFLSVVCAEEIPATTPENLDQAAAAYPALAEFAQSANYGSGQAITDICTAWGAAPFDPREAEPVVSDIPTLLFSGEYDPATPPYFATQTSENLANSFNYVIPGAGHVASLSASCPTSIFLSFLSDPSVQPDATCLEALSPTFQTPQTVLMLVPVENAAFAYSSVIPEGWSEVAPGTGTYAENIAASTALVLQAAPLPLDQILAALPAQFGLESLPEATATIAGDAFEWSVYRELSIQGQSADLALAEANGSTYIAILITTPAQQELFYNGAFLPALQAFAPLG